MRDNCEATTFNVVPGPGNCTKTDGEVTLAKFTAAPAVRGHGAWWIRQRDITLDSGDGIQATNIGGIVHSFTEVAAFGKGCVVAVSETVDNCDLAKSASGSLLTACSANMMVRRASPANREHCAAKRSI